MKGVVVWQGRSAVGSHPEVNCERSMILRFLFGYSGPEAWTPRVGDYEPGWRIGTGRVSYVGVLQKS